MKKVQGNIKANDKLLGHKDDEPPKHKAHHPTSNDHKHSDLSYTEDLSKKQTINLNFLD